MYEWVVNKWDIWYTNKILQFTYLVRDYEFLLNVTWSFYFILINTYIYYKTRSGTVLKTRSKK